MEIKSELAHISKKNKKKHKHQFSLVIPPLSCYLLWYPVWQTLVNLYYYYIILCMVVIEHARGTPLPL